MSFFRAVTDMGGNGGGGGGGEGDVYVDALCTLVGRGGGAGGVDPLLPKQEEKVRKAQQCLCHSLRILFLSSPSFFFLS